VVVFKGLREDEVVLCGGSVGDGAPAADDEEDDDDALADAELLFLPLS
jgi:hypothetical protein